MQTVAHEVRSLIQGELVEMLAERKNVWLG